MRTILILLISLASLPAFADEPTVTLTQGELEALVNAEVAKMMSLEAGQKAKVAYDKVTAAFKVQETKK